jgi:hypothetical protein
MELIVLGMFVITRYKSVVGQGCGPVVDSLPRSPCEALGAMSSTTKQQRKMS